jgi:hypothetical protein
MIARADADDLILLRMRHDARATLGRLILRQRPLCYTLEDRPPKVPGVKEPGHSRIPAGRWPLRLRGEGGFHDRYTRKWSWHAEMVEIVLPGWTYVLFHAGNYHSDTAGCVLVGESWGESAHGLSIWSSQAAYEDIYPVLRAHAAKGGFLTIVDEKD